jgi:4-hydroxybenzoate polyprenyltransferase
MSTPPAELTQKMHRSAPGIGGRVRLRAYAELIRLPNVFTAIADIALGWLCVSAGSPLATAKCFIVLALVSACLYSSGMVWNDFFDVEQDRRERPFRPIPSGRVSSRQAALIAGSLQAIGLLFAAAMVFVSDNAGWLPLNTAFALVFAILLYDGWLKRTWAGPLAMGSCRFLNVLLGLSMVAPEIFPWSSRAYLAGIIGTYIVGVTWFARTEAKMSSRTELKSATGMILIAMVLTLAAPKLVVASTPSILFPYLLVAFAFFIAFPLAAAVRKPVPALVQAAVKRCLGGLVMLDALLAMAVAGTVGLVILLLLLPVLFLGRWIYST